MALATWVGVAIAAPKIPSSSSDDEMMKKEPNMTPRTTTKTTGGTKSPRVGTGADPDDSPTSPTSKNLPVKWNTTWTMASAEARKNDKLVMMYFTGSDWEDFSKKLWRDVLSTQMFNEWAQKNVVLFLCDYPSEDLMKKQNPAIRSQNERFKQKYSIDKVPTIIFVDCDGEPYARCTYDQAFLRNDEKKGQPLKWLAIADDIVKTRPGKETLVVQKSFAEGTEYGKKHGLPFLLLITHDQSQKTLDANKALMDSQKFIRFVNRTMVFMQWNWPEDIDLSKGAAEFRKFVEEQKIGPAPSQLVLYYPNKKEVKYKNIGWSPTKVEAIRKGLEQNLPKFDYTGNWVTDFHLAQAISVQLKRELLVAFTSMDSSEWCQKMDAEIFKNEEFRAYAGKNLVLCRIDFPKTKPLAKEDLDRNNRLAEVYRVMGYPSVVLLNDGGQKIGMAKYQKGGPRPFLKEIDELRRKDFERRTLMSDQVEVKE